MGGLPCYLEGIMKKLKHQYMQSIQSTRHDYFGEVYPNVRSSIFKKFSTYQERSFYFLHRIELNTRTVRLCLIRFVTQKKKKNFLSL